MSVTISVTAETAIGAREELARLLYNCSTAQFNQPATAPVPLEDQEVGNCTNTTPTRAAEIAPAETNVTPIKRTRKPAARSEERVPEGVMSPDAPANKYEPGITKEAFVDKLKDLRAKFGEAVIPELRKILSEYKTADGEEVVRGSDVQISDMPAVAAKFAALEAKRDAAKAADVI